MLGDLSAAVLSRLRLLSPTWTLCRKHAPPQRGRPEGWQAETDKHFERRLQGWLERASVQSHVSPHTFRHTLASRLLAATGNLRLVQQALGHRSIASTVRYTQVPSDTLKAALEAV